MHTRVRVLAIVALLVIASVLTLSLASAARAQSGGGYDLSWSTVDGGGTRSTGGVYTVQGTAGQPDAGAQAGGSYTAGGGFWAALTEALHRLFVPIVNR